jgi:hypothetical protein
MNLLKAYDMSSFLSNSRGRYTKAPMGRNGTRNRYSNKFPNHNPLDYEMRYRLNAVASHWAALQALIWCGFVP